MISATPGREVRQELYQTPNTKKPDRMSGFFIAQIFINQVYKKLIE